MIARRSFFYVPLVLIAPALVAGCAGTTQAATLHLTIRGSANQNPDPAGEPAPVAIRLLLLAGMSRFERANVFALIAHEKRSLGSDLLRSEEVVISPGASLSITRSLPTGARFLGAAVLFRNIDHTDWRASAPLTGSGTVNLTLRITGTKAALSR